MPDRKNIISLMSEEDLEDIKNMREPSLEQATQLKRNWDNTTSYRLDAKDNTLAWVHTKLYLKCRDTFPEVFI
jgi:hypothetical protein